MWDLANNAGSAAGKVVVWSLRGLLAESSANVTTFEPAVCCPFALWLANNPNRICTGTECTLELQVTQS